MELYNYQLKTVASSLKSEDDVENRETSDSPIHKERVEKAVRMLKDGKSPGVDNIPVEILKRGGPGIIDSRQHTTLSELRNDQPDLSP